MERGEVLDLAKKYVTNDRQNDHGKPENTFGKIAQYWGVYLGTVLTDVDVAHLMILLKVARAQQNPTHVDNHADIAGYAACGCELATAVHVMQAGAVGRVLDDLPAYHLSRIQPSDSQG